MDARPPSTYHDPREVIWKHLVAQAYWDVIDVLRHDGVDPGEFEQARLAFLKSFNGQHDLTLLCSQAEASAAAILDVLMASNREHTSARIRSCIGTARDALQRTMATLREVHHVDRGTSYVAGGSIEIAGQPAEVFAANPDFICATLQLVREDDASVAQRARAAWRTGFALADDDAAFAANAAREDWTADDLIAETLLREQRSRRYPSLREFEYVPGRTSSANREAKQCALEQGFFLLGRLMSALALLNPGSAPLAPQPVDACPIAAMLAQANIVLTPEQLRAFRCFVLVRCTHGLNPGEFTARIAASVRTSFPQALLASLCVRAGKMHGGAFTECMRTLGSYLEAASRDDFAAQCIERGEIFGFGHRIHKPGARADSRRGSGDPRVAVQLATAKEAFPLQRNRIEAMEDFAMRVRQAKPTLAPNTDFGAAVWFHCLKLTPEMGSALFTMARLPGMIAQIVNQLDVKANALRPPLAVNLPYTL